jgi:hypothetical protein
MERSRSGDIRTDSESITQRHKRHEETQEGRHQWILDGGLLVFLRAFVSSWLLIRCSGSAEYSRAVCLRDGGTSYTE